MERKRCMLVMTALLAGAALNGCKPDAAVKQGEIIGRGTKDPYAAAPATPPDAIAPADATPAAPVAGSGSITGTILFSGKAPVRTIDTSMDPACSPGAKATLPTEQYVVKNGKLGNVFIYVKSGPPEAMAAGNTYPQPVVLDQVHCQYVPHVIGVMQGGFVQFRNSDVTMHNVHTMPTDVGNDTIDISEGPRGQPQTKKFNRPELMIPVRCNNHPWMNAFINVSATPFFTVSDADGHFDLHGLPAGNYVIGAVQEKAGEKTMNVTVTEHGTARAEFGFTAQ